MNLRVPSPVVALALALATPFPLAPQALSAQAVVQAYNARDFGSPGWRRLRLELKHGGRVTRIFSILHLWQVDRDEVHSLVYLEEPAGLKGTSYLLREAPGFAHGMELYLYLPAGKRRVLAVTPTRFDEGLLGSDFTYRDLLWLLPQTGHRLELAGATRMLDHRVWMIDAEPATEAAQQATSWRRIRYYVAPEPQLLLGADFFHAGATRPGKRLRVDSLARREGIWTPTRMTMRLAGGRSSVLWLLGADLRTGGFDADLFVPDLLAAASERLASDPAAALGLAATRKGAG